MARGSDRVHPQLRALYEEAADLNKLDIQLTAQLVVLGRELKKQRSEVTKLKKTMESLSQMYRDLKKAKVASLNEATTIRRILLANRDLLRRATERIRSIGIESKDITAQLETVKKNHKRVTTEMGKWNKLLRLK